MRAARDLVCGGTGGGDDAGGGGDTGGVGTVATGVGCVGAGGWGVALPIGSKWAETDLGAVARMTWQAPDPVHALPQPAKREPAAGAAGSAVVVPTRLELLPAVARRSPGEHHA